MPMQVRTRNILAAAILAGGVVMGASAAAIDGALDKGVQRAGKAQQSQQKIDAVDNSIRAAEREYRGLMKEVDGLNVYIAQLDRQLNAQQEELDRKSTRLNSSHVKNSYAVFCLKKKAAPNRATRKRGPT